MIQTRTERKTLISDDAFDAEDLTPEREDALERGLLEHDAMTFEGRSLRPMSVGTLNLMQRARLMILTGNTSNILADVMTFLLLHSEDNHAIRNAIYGGTLDDYIYERLEEWEGDMVKLTAFAPTIQKMMTDFFATQTRSIAPPGSAKKKRGRPTG